MLPGSVANLAVQVLLLFLGLFTGIVTARTLGPASRGELSFLVLIPAMLTVVASLGTEYGIYYFWHQEEGRLRSGLLATCVAVSLLSGAAFGALGYVVVTLIEPQTSPLLRFLVGLSMPLGVANAILTMALMGSGRTRRYNASRIAGPAMFTCAIGALWVARDIGVASAYLSWFGSMVVTVLTDIAMIFGLGTGKPQWNPRTARQSVAYGLRSCVGSAAQYGTLRLDQTMLAALAGNATLGLYYAAVSLGETLLYLASNIGAAMLGQFGRRSKAERRHLAVVTMAAVLVGTAAAAGLLILFGGEAIDLLFGKAYLPGLTALRILLPGLIPLALAQVMSGYFIAIGEARVFAHAAMAALIVTVVGNIVLIPAYQAAGAAIASSLAYLLMALWMAWAFVADRKTSSGALTVAHNRDTVPAKPRDGWGMDTVNETRAIQALDRPGSRWLAAAAASVAETLVRRRPTIVRPLPGGGFLHRHVDGVMVLPDVLTRRTPRDLEQATRDIFCFGYTPQPGDTVLDVGAGYGEETITFSRLVGPRGRVISVEAHPDTYRRLVLCCRYNNLSNVMPLQCAVADVETTVAIDDGTPEGGSITATIGRRGKTEVPAVTIDTIIATQECDRVDLLKMNIEGAERLAIRGMTRSLDRVQHIVISCHDFVRQPSYAGGDPAWFATYDTVTAFLQDVGFTLGERRSADPRPELPFYVYAAK